MSSVESSSSHCHRDFLCLRTRISLRIFIFYSWFSFLFGDSSHSFPCKEGGNTNPVPEVPREVSASPVGDENGAPGTLVMCPDNSRKNPNMLRLVTSTRTARVTNAARSEERSVVNSTRRG